MIWEQKLDRASFGDASFYCTKVSDDLARELARYSYPYVDGEDVEDMGGKAVETDLTAVFLGDEYLADLSELMSEVARGQAALFKHPILGTWMARASITRIEHDASMRDGCMVDLHLIRDGTNAVMPEYESVQSLKDELEDAADSLEESAEDLNLDDDQSMIQERVQDVLVQARSFSDKASSEATNAATEMNRTIRKIRQAISEVESLPDLESYPVVRDLRQLDRSVRRLGAGSLGNKWPMRERTLPVSTPAVLLAHQLYGDASRADEIVILNSYVIRNPLLLPAGVALMVFNK